MRLSTGASTILLSIATLSSRTMGDNQTAKSSASTFTVWVKERPTAAWVREWIKGAKQAVTADERSVIDGYTPRSLLEYTHVTVPAELTLGGDVTQTMVESRYVARLNGQDINSIRDTKRADHASEISMGL